MVIGSLGARIAELKQKVIAENLRRYGLAVPRKCCLSFLIDCKCLHWIHKSEVKELSSEYKALCSLALRTCKRTQPFTFLSGNSHNLRDPQNITRVSRLLNKQSTHHIPFQFSFVSYDAISQQLFLQCFQTRLSHQPSNPLPNSREVCASNLCTGRLWDGESFNVTIIAAVFPSLTTVTIQYERL